jgi:hypothetical protein
MLSRLEDVLGCSDVEEGWCGRGSCYPGYSDD